MTLDVVYGGAFYALVDSSCHGLTIDPANAATFVDLGRRIKVLGGAGASIDHPFEPELSFLYGVIFYRPSGDAGPSQPERVRVCRWRN